MLVLFTDTDTDITPREAKKYGYHLISMPYCIGDKTVYPYEDFEVFEPHAFYESLRGGTMPTTTLLSVERYIAYFEPVFANGDDILYVHFSAAMTSTFDIMEQALAVLREKYPERKFYSIDTKGITIESLNIVKEVGDLYLAGKTADEIVLWAHTEVDKFATYFFAEDLKFFARSGRVSGIAAFMGGMFGIRPIICMNAEGKMVSVGKEKGRANALARLVKYVEELGDDLENHRIIIGHSDSPELAQKLGYMLYEKFGAGINIEYAVVNPTAGSHCGPDGIGVCFHAKHR